MFKENIIRMYIYLSVCLSIYLYLYKIYIIYTYLIECIAYYDNGNYEMIAVSVVRMKESDNFDFVLSILI